MHKLEDLKEFVMLKLVLHRAERTECAVVGDDASGEKHRASVWVRGERLRSRGD